MARRPAPPRVPTSAWSPSSRLEHVRRAFQLGVLEHFFRASRPLRAPGRGCARQETQGGEQPGEGVAGDPSKSDRRMEGGAPRRSPLGY